MIYLYAIINRPGGVLPSLLGLENAPLAEVIYQEIAGVYHSFTPSKETTTPLASEENLWKHEAVLEALMPDHAVLPLRFGSTLSGDWMLQALLHDRYTSYAANLQRVQGCVELSLHIIWPKEAFSSRAPIVRDIAQTDDHAPVMSGKEYLLSLRKARQQEYVLRQQIETQIGELLHNLEQLVVENTRVISLTPNPSLKAAFLLAQAEVPHFRQEVGYLSTAHPELHFALTGPWPPYNFVSN